MAFVVLATIQILIVALIAIYGSDFKASQPHTQLGIFFLLAALVFGKKGNQ